MKWGKHSTAVAVCCLAVAITGCGSDSSSSTSTTADSAGATADVGATGATGAAKKHKAKKKKQAAPSASSSGGSSSSKVSATNNPTVQTTSPDQLKVPVFQTGPVKAVFAKNIAAIRNGDASELCNNVYATDFVKTFDDRGGCEAVTAKQIAGITSYKSKITSISRFPNSNLVVVYANFTFTNATGTHHSKGGLYFKTQNGEWKRATPAS
jgi:hypothetical protein